MAEYTVDDLQSERVDLPDPILPPGFDLAQIGHAFWARLTGWEVCPAKELFAWLHVREQLELAAQAFSPDLPHGDVLEVGAGWGASGTLLAIGNEARGRGELVTSLDVATSFQRAWIDRALQPLCVDCRPASTETFSDWTPLRLGFVDGDHSPEWAWKDVKAVGAHIVDGGVLLLHDCHSPACPGPSEVWEKAEREGWLDYGAFRLVPMPPLVCTMARFRVERG